MDFIQISNIDATHVGTEIAVRGWVLAKRQHKNVVFVDLIDTSVAHNTEMRLQLVAESANSVVYECAQSLTPESYIEVTGTVVSRTNSIELKADSLHLVAPAENISPPVRGNFDALSSEFASQVLGNRHLYMRNPRYVALLKYRHFLMQELRRWFDAHGFYEVTTPVLTSVPLYDDGSAIPVQVKGRDGFLTQCSGYYLEAAVAALGKVYNLGPTFRGEESRSPRHLMEYWHIKLEANDGGLEDAMSTVEALIRHAAKQTASYDDLLVSLETEDRRRLLNTEAPFARITYRDAIRLVSQELGVPFEFGKSLGAEEEKFISLHFGGPVWVMYAPRAVEPFMYRINPDDDATTLTADLLASGGYGELLGVAEKITTLSELEVRMKEKGKDADSRYRWVKDLRQYGSAPHYGAGIGLERLMRWLLQVEQVRDCIPFPRTHGRSFYP